MEPLGGFLSPGMLMSRGPLQSTHSWGQFTSLSIFFNFLWFHTFDMDSFSDWCSGRTGALILRLRKLTWMAPADIHYSRMVLVSGSMDTVCHWNFLHDHSFTVCPCFQFGQMVCALTMMPSDCTGWMPTLTTLKCLTWMVNIGHSWLLKCSIPSHSLWWVSFLMQSLHKPRIMIVLFQLETKTLCCQIHGFS